MFGQDPVDMPEMLAQKAYLAHHRTMFCFIVILVAVGRPPRSSNGYSRRRACRQSVWENLGRVCGASRNHLRNLGCISSAPRYCLLCFIDILIDFRKPIRLSNGKSRRNAYRQSVWKNLDCIFGAPRFPTLGFTMILVKSEEI